jgi:eukaryotic-like serine/threonine-protein kinase
VSPDVLGGRYRLEQQLSSTQMADVWLGHDAVLERRVVVKLLAPAADRLRFEREARAVAALTHPNIVQLYDYGEEGERPYMVLEHMPGGTLADRLREGEQLPDEQTRAIATDVAAGLAHAHRHGVVHRDLKPGNVLFDGEGRAKVADFGIARVQGIDTLTEAGTVLGTAAYMSPEQVAGEQATPESDVYAFGLLLYRMLTGRLPFESENALELAAMQRDVPAPPIRSIRPDVPADLAALATAALAKDRTARPPDGAALLAAVEPPELPGTAVTEVSDAPTRLMAAPPPPAPPPAAAARRLWPRVLIGAVVLLAAGIAAAVLVFGSPSSTPAVTGSTPATSTHPPTTQTTAPTATTSPTATQTTAPTTTTRPAPTTSHTTTSAPPPPTTRPTTRPTTTTATTTAPPPPTTTPTTTAATTTEPPPAAGTTTAP